MKITNGQRDILRMATALADDSAGVEKLPAGIRDILRTLKMVMSTDSQKVESSMLSNISYDENTRKLEVEFNSGGIYVYTDVEEDIYRGLTKAASKGRYFWRHIKPWYKYEKLQAQPV